jgi:hypothetical protein
VSSPDSATSTAADLYLDLLEQVLTGAVYEDSDTVLGENVRGRSLPRRAANWVGRRASAFGVELVVKRPYDAAAR